MALEKTTKQEWERYFIHGDFSAVLGELETISLGDCTFICVDKDGNDVTTSIVESASAYVDGSLVYVRIRDGVEEESPYKLTIRIETSEANRYEVDGNIKVIES